MQMMHHIMIYITLPLMLHVWMTITTVTLTRAVMNMLKKQHTLMKKVNRMITRTNVNMAVMTSKSTDTIKNNKK